MPQLVSPSGFRENSLGSTQGSACPVSGQRLCLAKGLQVSPGAGGGGGRGVGGAERGKGRARGKALLGPLCCLQASLPLNLHPGGHG